jgi:hypothetical protein
VKGKEPFISKGRGKSLMVSDFLVAHTSGPFFSLNETEWSKCVAKYPSILEFRGVNYIERTCTGSMQPGQDNYFSSETVLNQFERLFQMLQFKNDFNSPVKHQIEIVVDKARTHTAQLVNIKEFCLKPGGRCPVETLTYVDETGADRTISCYDEGVSKGLKKKAIKLGYNDLDSKIGLLAIQNILIQHPAFSPIKKLTKLAEKYCVKVIFCPKFHCELNPIEGLWCNQKCLIRRRTDQTFIRLISLLNESRSHFIDIKLVYKLLRRFWNCLYGYQNKRTYAQIMIEYFSGKFKGKNLQQPLIINYNL